MTSSSFILSAAVKILGDILSLDSDIREHVQTFLENNGLDLLSRILSENQDDKGLTIDTLWALSNLAADSASSALTILQHQDIFTTFHSILTSPRPPQVRKETIIVISNVLTNIPAPTVKEVIHQNQELVRAYFEGL